ncbi:MAG: hypothetical protein GYB65_18710 [Chloroflexi bacterium]|nr:hypothetical protein [Chloroflexota bacterium]
MKRVILMALGLLALVMALAACSSVPVREAYTAAGESSNPNNVTEQDEFSAFEDLNVVIELNRHSHKLLLQAVFRPLATGQEYWTNVQEAEETTGTVLLGLSWDGTTGGEPWPSGEWQVDILVDQEVEDTVSFTVRPATEPIETEDPLQPPPQG